MNKLTKVIINGALFFAVQTPALAASEVEKPVSDAEKITRLERIVENLQERVGQLEKLPKSTNAASAKEEKIDPKSGWKYRDSWLKLKCELRAEISLCNEIKQLKTSAFSFMTLANSNPLISKC